MIIIGHFSPLPGALQKLKIRLTAATTSLRDMLQSMLRNAVWQFGWRIVAISVIGYQVLHSQALSDPLLHMTANTLTMLTGLLLGCSFLVVAPCMLLSFWVRERIPTSSQLYDDFMTKLPGFYWILDIVLLYFVGAALLQVAGPTALQAARTYPQEAIAVALASGMFVLVMLCAVMMLLFRQQAALRIRLEELVQDDDPVAARLKQLKTELQTTHTAPHPFEQQQMAAYLAGQVLCCAALVRVPARIDTRMYGPLDWDFLDAMAADMDLRRLRELEDWLLLCLLAGGAADIRLRGSLSHPLVRQVADDNARWQVTVRDYLAFYYRQPYFANPHNAFEAMWAEQIDATVDTLQELQMGIVTRFLTENESVLRELATVIRSKSVLGRDDLQPFFARVTFPGDFPRPGAA